MKTHRRKPAADGFVLQGRLAEAERVVLGLGWDRRGSLVMVRASTVAAARAFVVVSVMKTLLRGLGRERQGCDIRSGRRAGHDEDGQSGLQDEMFRDSLEKER